MEVQDIEKVEVKRTKGTASTVKANVIPVYAERVSRFLRDNQPTMGDEWVQTAGSRLYRFSGKNQAGDILGSSSDMGVALATFCPEVPLITGQQLLSLYEQAGDKNPFGQVYIDFGVQINGKPKVNEAQAKIFLEEFKDRGIKVGQGRVPNFNQLRLIADNDAGLVYKLATDASEDNIAVTADYPFEGRVGKDGLFRACLVRDGYWFAYVVCLPGSCDYGRGVRYDAEGVAPKKLARVTTESDLVESLTSDFLSRF